MTVLETGKQIVVSTVKSPYAKIASVLMVGALIFAIVAAIRRK